MSLSSLFVSALAFLGLLFAFLMKAFMAGRKAERVSQQEASVLLRREADRAAASYDREGARDRLSRGQF